MLQKVKKISEIFFDRELRAWALFRLCRPWDKGPKKEVIWPPYLKGFDRAIALDSPDEIALPNLQHLPFDSQCKLTSIELASESIKFENIFDHKSYQFADPENHEAVYRFGFLIKSICELDCYGQNHIDLIEFWLNSNENNQYALNPYTISERISNISIFLCRTQLHINWPKEKQKAFLNKLSIDVLALLDNLEYWGESLTCNHLSNNGRGLLWASLIFKSIELRELGFSIMSHEYSRIVLPQGMIREGSSHYQFLVARNYFEAKWILEVSNEHKKAQQFEKYVDQLVAGCQFFLMGPTIPFFGDVSPDFDFHYFRDIAFSQNPIADQSKRPAQGWGKHFFKTLSESGLNSKKHVLDEYTKIANNSLSAFVKINSNGYPLINGHGHCDSASPIIFYGDIEVISERGRFNYLAESDAFKTAYAHNGFLINNRSLERPLRGFFGPKYIENRFGEVRYLREGEQSISVLFEGFYGNQMSFKRKVSLISPNEINIDHFLLEGPSTARLSLFFHSANPQMIDLIWPAKGVSRDYESTQSYEYGKTSFLKTFQWCGKIKKDEALSVIIRIRENEA